MKSFATRAFAALLPVLCVLIGLGLLLSAPAPRAQSADLRANVEAESAATDRAPITPRSVLAQAAKPAKPTKPEADKSPEYPVLDVELIDGQRLMGAELVAVTLEGVEIKLAGVTMQVMWQLLRPDPLLEHRKKLVDVNVSASVEDYAIWASSVGLEDEFEWADSIYKGLNNGKSLRPEPEPAPVIERPRREPEKPEAGKDPRETAKPEKKEPEPKGTRFSTELTIECKDEALKALLEEYLEDYGFTIKKRGGATKIEITTEVKLVKRASFFGDVLFAVYKQTADASITINKKDEVAKDTFDSGDQKAEKDHLAKEAARNMLAIALYNWIREESEKERK